jgi:hypothetical protein
VGSSKILLVDREPVQSGVLTRAVVGQLEQLPLLKMGINANDCGIVKWRETVGLQTPRESRECMGSRHSSSGRSPDFSAAFADTFAG